MPLLAVTRTERPADVVLRVSGDLDMASVPLLRREVEAGLATRPARLFIDLSETDFLDSTGCRELVGCARAGAEAGVPVELVVPPADNRVRWIVEFTGLPEVLPLHDALPAA